MKLYIINPTLKISNTLSKYLLEHFTPYNGEVCDIVEVNNLDGINFKSGYLSKLTIGKLQQQANKNIKYYILNDIDDVIYYLVQTLQIVHEDIIRDICYNNASKSLKVLIDQGINVNIRYNYRDPPLHDACYYNSVEIVKLLLDQGANINIQNNSDWTPLHYACCNNSFESVKLLLDNGANVNIQNIYGDTPLHFVCHYNRVEIAKLLMDNGAKTDIQNTYRDTPLQLAENNDSEDCISLLQTLKNR